MAAYEPAPTDKPRVRAPSFWLPDANGRDILYTYIRKNACSVFKSYIRRHADGASWKNPAVRLHKVRPAELAERPADIAIFVYRDPFERVVSAYLNKFVMRSGARDVFANYARLTGKPPQEATFLDLLDYIGQGPDRIDPHFWKQRSHLLPITYTHPIPLARLSSEMAGILGNQPHADVFRGRRNHTDYGDATLSGAVERPADALRALRDRGQLLSPDTFRTAESMARVAHAYRDDYEMIAGIEAQVVPAR